MRISIINSVPFNSAFILFIARCVSYTSFWLVGASLIPCSVSFIAICNFQNSFLSDEISVDFFNHHFIYCRDLILYLPGCCNQIYPHKSFVLLSNETIMDVFHARFVFLSLDLKFWNVFVVSEFIRFCHILVSIVS